MGFEADQLVPVSNHKIQEFKHFIEELQCQFEDRSSYINAQHAIITSSEADVRLAITTTSILPIWPILSCISNGFSQASQIGQCELGLRSEVQINASTPFESISPFSAKTN